MNTVLVFPVRRRVALLTLLAGAAVLAGWTGILARQLTDNRPNGLALGITVVGTALIARAVLMELWMVVTGRPVVTVDQDGIAYGRRRLAWNEIERVELMLTGRANRWFGLSYVRVTPSGGRSRRMNVTRQHVADIEEFAQGLRDAVDHRRTTAGPGSGG